MVRNKNNYSTHTFPNGFQIVYQNPKHELPITSIQIFCKVGSAWETDSVRGMSHFIEHMCFKGTKEIVESRDIFIEYDKIGAEFNAYTTKEFTCYTIKCEDKFTENCTHILADMLSHSTFQKKEFDKEQKVVIEENVQDEDDADNVLSEKIDAIMYCGSSLAYSVDSLSYHPTEKHLKREDMLEWFSHFYQPKNMIMSVVTHLPFSQIKKIIQKEDLVKSSSSSSSSSSDVIKSPSTALENPNYTLLPVSGIEYVLLEKKGFTAHTISIGFRTCPRSSPDRYLLRVLKQIFNGLSGRLFTLLRQESGLTYQSGVDVEYFRHTGSFLVNTDTDSVKTKKVITVIMKLFHDLLKDGVTERELEVAKGNIRGNMLLYMEDNDNIADYNGQETLFSGDKLFSRDSSYTAYEDIFKKYIEPVTKEQIQGVIDRYFKRENMVVGVIGEKIPSKKSIEKICESFF